MISIPLTGKYGQGKSVMISESDYEKLKGRAMYPLVSGYVMIWDKEEYGVVYLHRLLKGCKKGDGVVVDHIDGDKLNCTQENLCITTHSQNMSNRAKHIMPSTTPQSNYVGVTRTGTKWTATIRKDSIKHNLGTYDTEEEAAFAYNKKALELHRTYATLNIVDGKVLP